MDGVVGGWVVKQVNRWMTGQMTGLTGEQVDDLKDGKTQYRDLDIYDIVQLIDKHELSPIRKKSQKYHQHLVVFMAQTQEEFNKCLLSE